MNKWLTYEMHGFPAAVNMRHYRLYNQFNLEELIGVKWLTMMNMIWPFECWTMNRIVVTMLLDSIASNSICTVRCELNSLSECDDFLLDRTKMKSKSVVFCVSDIFHFSLFRTHSVRGEVLQWVQEMKMTQIMFSINEGETHFSH